MARRGRRGGADALDATGTTGDVDFAPTGGWPTAVAGIATAGLVAVVAIADWSELGLPVLGVALLVLALVWTAVLRPRLRIEGETLVLRNSFSTARLPLAGLTSALVQQTFVARVGGRRFTSGAAGRSRRQAMRQPRTTRELAMSPVPGEGLPVDDGVLYADHIERQIQQRAEAARRERGITHRSREQQALESEIEVTTAWPEIAMVAAAVLVIVVGVLLG